MKQVLSYVITDESVTLYVSDNGNFYPVAVPEDDPSYPKVVAALKTGDTLEALRVADKAKVVEEWATDTNVSIENGVVSLNGMKINNALTRRIVKMAQENLPTKPLELFLENLIENPSNQSVRELFMFLESNELPITEDGHFLAYKAVSGNYKDMHSNTFDNSVGSVCSMPRNHVNDNRDVTCSYGLHFASLPYVRSFGGAHIMVLKINPKDVVSIPNDYNNQKGRCCEYKVIGEATHEVREEKRDPLEEQVIVETNESFDDGDYDFSKSFMENMQK